MRAHACKRHRVAALLMVLVQFASTASADDGTYVVGVEPKTVSLVIHPGKINKDGAFISNVRLRILPGTQSAQVAPYGLVIGQTKSDTTYAIISVSDGNRLYQACDGAEGFTLTLPKGEAVYLVR